MFACMNVKETFNTCYMCLGQGYQPCTSSKTWNQSPKLVIISHLGYIYIYPKWNTFEMQIQIFKINLH